MNPHLFLFLLVTLLALLIPLFCWADRGIGGACPRSTVIASVLATAGSLAIYHQPASAIMCLVWLVYRTPAWALGGTTTPHGLQILWALWRHSLPAGAAWLLYAKGLAPAGLPMAFVGYAVGATGLSIGYAREIDFLKAHALPETGQNEEVEMARGALYGIALAAVAILAVVS